METNKTVLTQEERSNLEKNCEELANCNDVMPKTLQEHQDNIRNSCLDMIYDFESLLTKKMEERDGEEYLAGMTYAWGILKAGGDLNSLNEEMQKLADKLKSKYKLN